MAALFLLYTRWKKQKIKIIGNPVLVQQLISNYSPKKFTVKFCLAAIAFTLLAIALANPRKPVGNSTVKRNGIDVMIALDVSKSMLAQDIKPNRLERAKQLVSKLIDKMPDNRVGIVVFAGRAYLQMPLTPDLVAAKLYLSTASTEVVPTQGTVIGDALKMCYASFNTKEKKYKSIILVTDGEDHDDNAEKLSRSLADEGVVVNTVGIGSAEGATIDDPITGEQKRDAEGKIVMSKLNETELKNIATATGGIYRQFTNTDEVANAIEEQLNSMGKRGITETSLAAYLYYFQWLLGAALSLLMIDFFMADKKGMPKQRAVTHTATAAIFAFIMLFPAGSFSQTSTHIIHQGNELYNKKKYGEAAANYKKVIDKTPGNATAQYNLGNALYKDNNTADAMKAYEQAITFSKDNKEKGEAFYNKGVALQNDKKIADCIDAYKTALKLNPLDQDARLNLQKALKEQKQKEKQKEDRQKKQDKQQQQKQQPRPPKPQQSKMTKKEAEEKLKALLQQEKNLQDKLKKVDANASNKPEKDW